MATATTLAVVVDGKTIHVSEADGAITIKLDEYNGYVGKIGAKDLEGHAIFKDCGVIMDAIGDISAKATDKYCGKLGMRANGDDYVLTLSFDSKFASDKLEVAINHVVATADDSFHAILTLTAKIIAMQEELALVRAKFDALAPVVQIPMTNGEDIVYLSPLMITKCTMMLLAGELINMCVMVGDMKFVPVMSVSKVGKMSKWSAMTKARAMTLFASFLNVKALDLIITRDLKVDLAQFVLPTHCGVEEITIGVVDDKKMKTDGQVDVMIAPILGYKGLKKLVVEGDGINIMDREKVVAEGVKITLPVIEGGKKDK